MKKIFLIIMLMSLPGFAQRIKDVAYFKGVSAEQIIGYGLVVGLTGTGDTYRSSFTVQSVTSMLKRFGITVPQTDLRIRNVAAVMITTKLNGYMKEGAEFDVTVASMGDATSLTGGVLLVTPLSGMNGDVYGFAQGPVSTGGYDITTASGGRVAKNHSTSGRIPGGGVLEKAVNNIESDSTLVSIIIKNPDFTTANNIVAAINSAIGTGVAKAIDAAEVTINVPADKQGSLAAFLSELEAITIQSDAIAKVVLNERTGTIVAGSNVKILPVTISHGSLNITIRSLPIVSQPGAFSQGSTVFFNNLVPNAQQDTASAVAIQGAGTVQEVASALNSLKVSPRDIIAIFQALKESGALIAELVII